jgi:hypothetical protein
LKALRWLLPAFAGVGFIATFLFEASFQARSTLVQLVRKEEGRWVTVGKPAEWVAVPQAAVVEPGREGVATLVDGARVREPVLAMDAIRRFAWVARIGCLLALALGVFGPRLIDRVRSTEA